MSKRSKKKQKTSGSNEEVLPNHVVAPPSDEKRSKTSKKRHRVVTGDHEDTQQCDEKKNKKRSSTREEYLNIDETDEETNGVKENVVRHPFPTNPLDHCETPFQAYNDLKSCLNSLCKHLNLTPTTLKIWDPYFCDGRVKDHLVQLGFTNIRNENRDFYERIKDNDMPDYDLLLTNPPYSDDHVDRLMQFCKSQTKPFALLMPNWVARKKVYVLRDEPMFYLSPSEAYTYIMPTWAEERRDHIGEDGTTRPYCSSWYIGGLTKQISERFHDEMDRVAKNQTWVVAKTIKGLKWKIQKNLRRQW